MANPEHSDSLDARYERFVATVRLDEAAADDIARIAEDDQRFPPLRGSILDLIERIRDRRSR